MDAFSRIIELRFQAERIRERKAAEQKPQPPAND